MTPEERKAKVLELRKEHENHFESTNNKNALYIPKIGIQANWKR